MLLTGTTVLQGTLMSSLWVCSLFTSLVVIIIQSFFFATEHTFGEQPSNLC